MVALWGQKNDVIRLLNVYVLQRPDLNSVSVFDALVLIVSISDNNLTPNALEALTSLTCPPHEAFSKGKKPGK